MIRHSHESTNNHRSRHFRRGQPVSPIGAATGVSVKGGWCLQKNQPVPGTREFSEGSAGRPSRGARCRIVVISVLRDGLPAFPNGESRVPQTALPRQRQSLGRVIRARTRRLLQFERRPRDPCPETISEDRDDYNTASRSARWSAGYPLRRISRAAHRPAILQ